MLNKLQLEKLISDKFPGTYNPAGLNIVLSSIERSDSDIREKIEHYLTNGEEPALELEGYSYATLKNDHGMNPIAALLTLDWLKRSPEEAKESLKKGHDFVGSE